MLATPCCNHNINKGLLNILYSCSLFNLTITLAYHGYGNTIPVCEHESCANTGSALPSMSLSVP